MNDSRQQQPEVHPGVDTMLVLFVYREADDFEHGTDSDAQAGKDDGPVVPQNARYGERMNSGHDYAMEIRSAITEESHTMKVVHMFALTVLTDRIIPYIFMAHNWSNG